MIPGTTALEHPQAIGLTADLSKETKVYGSSQRRRGEGRRRTNFLSFTERGAVSLVQKLRLQKHTHIS